MRQENSVLFALRDLRSIEAERLEEEHRAEAARLAAEQELAARLKREREREEDERRRLEEQRAHERAMRAADQALQTEVLRRETEARSTLEAEVRWLRAQTLAPPAARADRRVPFAILAGASVIAFAVIAWSVVAPREHVVYLSSPAPAPIAPAPTAPAAIAMPQIAFLPEATPAAPSIRPKPKHRPARPVAAPRVDCSHSLDPLCGAKGLELD